MAVKHTVTGSTSPRAILLVFVIGADQCLVNSGIKKLRFGSDAPDNSAMDHLESLLSRSRKISKGRDFADTTPVMIAYTSGSTGLPKGAVLTHRTLLYASINAVQLAEMTCQDHILTNLPMFHVGGLTVQTLPTLYIGATVTIHREFDAARTLRDIESRRITVYLPLPKISRALCFRTILE